MEPTIRLKIQIVTPPSSSPAGMPSVKQLLNGNGTPAAKGKGAKDQKTAGANGSAKNEGHFPAERIAGFVNGFLTALEDAPAILPELEALIKVRSENDELLAKLNEKERERIDQLDEKDRDLERREKELRAVIDSKDALLEKEGRMWRESILKELSTESVSAGLLKEKEKEITALTAAHQAEVDKITRQHEAESRRLQTEADKRFEASKKDMESKLQLAKKETIMAQKERDEYKAKLDELHAQLSRTKTLLAAEELHRKAREDEIAKFQQDMGLKDLVEPEL
jgi:DNA repair exonuclease SbcCD ATPase subunit